MQLVQKGLLAPLKTGEELKRKIDWFYEMEQTPRVDFCFVAHGAPMRHATSLQINLDNNTMMLRALTRSGIPESRELILMEHIRHSKEKGLFLFVQACHGSGFLGLQEKKEIAKLINREDITFISVNSMDDTAFMGDERSLKVYTSKIRAYFEKKGTLCAKDESLYFQTTEELVSFCRVHFDDVYVDECLDSDEEWMFFEEDTSSEEDEQDSLPKEADHIVSEAQLRGGSAIISPFLADEEKERTEMDVKSNADIASQDIPSHTRDKQKKRSKRKSPSPTFFDSTDPKSNEDEQKNADRKRPKLL